MGIINVDFDATGQLMTIYPAFVKYLRKKWEYNKAVHQLFIDFKKAYGSVRREVLYNILIEFGIPLKLVKLIKMCLTETCGRVRVGKNLCDMFPEQASSQLIRGRSLKSGIVSVVNAFKMTFLPNFIFPQYDNLFFIL